MIVCHKDFIVDKILVILIKLCDVSSIFTTSYNCKHLLKHSKDF